MLPPRPLALAILLFAAPACIGSRVIHPIEPTGVELAEFEAAGPPVTTIETDRLVALKIGGPYKLVAGDLLNLTLPAEVFPDAEEGAGAQEMKVRVDRDGEVHLPLLGDFPVAGLTLAEAEDAIAEAYHDPNLLKERPNVVCTIEDYRTVAVAVMGAVNSPGIHGLRSDRLTVLGALMAAGGIHPERGASFIRVVRPDDEGDPEVVPVRSMDIPLQDIPLQGGETVVVEPQDERQFAVVGLAKKVGVFPYPYPRQFNLLQAIATAGGVDETAAPRYATIYRKKEDGKIIAATFRIDGLELKEGSNVLIKDGDVIAIEHTEGSWFRQFMSQVFGFRISGSTATSL